MPWDRFLLFNTAGGILWATLYGLGGYALGDNIHRLTGPVGVASVVLAILALVASLVILRRREAQLEAEAERALPGPLTTGRLGASTRVGPP
jgi:membrane protein DedA with SNARE-associated domain